MRPVTVPVVCCANANAQVSSTSVTAPSNFLIIPPPTEQKNQCPTENAVRTRSVTEIGTLQLTCFLTATGTPYFWRNCKDVRMRAAPRIGAKSAGLSLNVIGADGSVSLLDRPQQSLNFRALRRVCRQTRQQLTRGHRGVRSTAGPGVGEREIEARFVESRIGGERGFERADRAREIALRALQDAKVGGDHGVARLALTGGGERPLRAGQVVAPAETGGEPEMRVGGRQSAVDGPREFLFGPRAVARLEACITEAQVRLTVARIDFQDLLERRHQRRAGQLTGRHLRDARRDVAAIFWIRARHCGLRI